eukprot:1991161-Pleurochrysis_carterae.AAC.3
MSSQADVRRESRGEGANAAFDPSYPHLWRLYRHACILSKRHLNAQRHRSSSCMKATLFSSRWQHHPARRTDLDRNFRLVQWAGAVHTPPRAHTRLSRWSFRSQVLAEFTLTKLDALDEFYLIGNRDSAQHDLAWLEQARSIRLLVLANLRDDMHADPTYNFDKTSVEIIDQTDEIEIIHLAGPRSLSLLSAIARDENDEVEAKVCRAAFVTKKL